MRFTSTCADAHFTARTQAIGHIAREALNTHETFVGRERMYAACASLSERGVKVTEAGELTLTELAAEVVQRVPTINKGGLAA